MGAGQAIDLKYVEESSRQISKFAKGFTIVVERCTPVKTAQTIKEILETSLKLSLENENNSFSVLSNPEFLAEGSAISD